MLGECHISFFILSSLYFSLTLSILGRYSDLGVSANLHISFYPPYKEDYRPKYFNEFVHEVEQLQGVKNVYIFSWGDVGSFDSYFEYLSGVNLKSIPQPILDIYKSLNA